MQAAELHTSPLKDSEWNGKTQATAKATAYDSTGPAKYTSKGHTDDHSPYAEAIITDNRGNIKVRTSIDFYSLCTGR